MSHSEMVGLKGGGTGLLGGATIIKINMHHLAILGKKFLN